MRCVPKFAPIGFMIFFHVVFFGFLAHMLLEVPLGGPAAVWPGDRGGQEAQCAALNLTAAWRAHPSLCPLFCSVFSPQPKY